MDIFNYSVLEEHLAVPTLCLMDLPGSLLLKRGTEDVCVVQSPHSWPQAAQKLFSPSRTDPCTHPCLCCSSAPPRGPSPCSLPCSRGVPWARLGAVLQAALTGTAKALIKNGEFWIQIQVLSQTLSCNCHCG